jgi:hypothetical protein
VKAVSLVAKQPSLFSAIISAAMQLGYDVECDLGSALVKSIECDNFALIFDRDENDFYERYHLPDSAAASGYKFSYLVEFKDSNWFCEFAKRIGSLVDLVVCDNDGNVFRVQDLDAAKLAG